MSFAHRFSEIISRINSKVAAEIQMSEMFMKRLILDARYDIANTDDKFYFYTPAFSMSTNRSNHEKLSKIAFLDSLRKDILELHDLLRESIPVLDVPDFSLEMEFRKTSKTSAQCLRFTLCGRHVNERWVTLPTLVKNMEYLYAVLSDLPKPTLRSFRIGQRTVHAQNPKDAMQIYLALENLPPKTDILAYASNVEMSEIIKDKSFVSDLPSILLQPSKRRGKSIS